MDDNTFDDLLKNKFENYEHPDLGPVALATFHNRVSSVQSVPRHNNYRTVIWVAALFTLFTLINGIIVWYGISANENNLSEMAAVENFKTIDSLRIIIDQLKAINQKPSVFIIDPNDINRSKLESKHIREDYGKEQAVSTLNTNSKLYLGDVASLPQDIFNRLTEEGVLETNDGKAYLLITDRITRIRHRSLSFNPQSQLLIANENDTLDSDEIEEKVKTPEVVKLANRLSIKMINKIADHKYTKGIGINLMPHLDLVKGVYSRASGGLTPRVGLTAEWVVSPHWSIETSFDYMTTKFTINKDFQSFNLPNVNTDLGNLERAQISTRTFSLPVNLVYRWWLTQMHQLVIRGGFTPYLNFRNQYEYTYPYPGSSADSDLSISTVEQNDQIGYYGGTLNMSVGVNKLIKKKNQFEVALFYEKNLGKVGAENLGMQLFGLRTGYSIRVK